MEAAPEAEKLVDSFRSRAYKPGSLGEGGRLLFDIVGREWKGCADGGALKVLTVSRIWMELDLSIPDSSEMRSVPGLVLPVSGWGRG